MNQKNEKHEGQLFCKVKPMKGKPDMVYVVGMSSTLSYMIKLCDHYPVTDENKTFWLNEAIMDRVYSLQTKLFV